MASLATYCSSQTSDSLKQEAKWRPYAILLKINERPIFALDTNGYTFQFGYNSVLANIYEYYNKKLNVEDSLLLFYVKEINNQSEINVNNMKENNRKRIIYHFADLMTKGECRIVNNQNKAIIKRIAWMGYLNRDHTGGWIFHALDKDKYKEILRISDK